MRYKLKYLFKLNKYPQYFIDVFGVFFYKILLKKNHINFGANSKLLGLPIIIKHPNSEITIGKDCLICSRPSQTALGVSHKVILRTLREGAKLIIGNNVRMSGTTICCAKEIIIGDRCVIGADVVIADTDFHSLDLSLRSSDKDALNAKIIQVKIDNDVFIGGRTIILKGVELGRGVIVGAGSVVTRSFKEGSIIAGNPAKLIGLNPIKK